MRNNTVSAGSETYKFKMTIFNNGIPEELLQFMMKVKKDIEVTGTMKVARRINFLRTILLGEALR